MVLHSIRPLALAATAGLWLTGAAFAQSSAPLSTMPLPPSASDPLPKETAKKKPASDKPAARKRETQRGAEGAGTGGASTTQRRSTPATSATNAERPKRFVPAEFDRGEEGSRAKPFVSESGRPGMGMRF